MESESWDIAFLNFTRVVVQYILVPMVVTFGVFGNLITIHVLTKREMRVASNM